MDKNIWEENLPTSKEILNETRDGKTFRAYIEEENQDCLITIYKDGRTRQVMLDKPVFYPFVNECQVLLDTKDSEKANDVRIVDMIGNWIIVQRSEKADHYKITVYEPRSEEPKSESFEATTDEIKKILNSRKTAK